VHECARFAKFAAHAPTRYREVVLTVSKCGFLLLRQSPFKSRLVADCLTLDRALGSILAPEVYSMDRTAFRIGEVASGAGVSVDTVRYYERLKLLSRAGRSSGNFRLFAPESIERVRFIKQAQELGLTLEEIGGLLVTGGADECRRVCELLSEKIEELDTKMRAMKEFRRTLARHHAACKRELEAHGNSARCPVVTGNRKAKS